MSVEKSIFVSRVNVLNFYKNKYLDLRKAYIDTLESLIAFTSYCNMKYILKCEAGEVHCNDDYTLEGLHARFGIDNTTRLLDLIEETNKAFNLYNEAYISYYVKAKELGF